MLDGNYSFRSTVYESSSNQKYPFTLKLQVKNNNITGQIDYFNDNCSGKVKGKILSDSKLELSEKIIKGSDLCDNGLHLFELKYHLISKAIYYNLSNEKNKVVINKYDFVANKKSWDNLLLKKKITDQETEIKKLQNKIIQTKELITKAKETKQKAQNYLDYNLSNFSNNSCKTPPLSKKPKPFFDTEEKAQKHALAYCSVSFGCRVGIELARAKLNTASKIFLASQGCTLLIKDYIGNNTLGKETMFNLLDSVSYEGCESESDGILSAVFKGGSCLISTATRLTRASQYINCISYKTEEFHSTYLDWKNEPQKKKMDCEAHLKIITDTPKTIVKYKKKISELTDRKNENKKKLEELKDELEKIEALRKKQLKLINHSKENQ
jgi:cell division protein FtsB